MLEKVAGQDASSCKHNPNKSPKGSLFSFFFLHVGPFICGANTLGPSSVRHIFQVVFAQCDRLIWPDRGHNGQVMV